MSETRMKNLKEKKGFWLCCDGLLAVLLIIADQWTKQLAVRHLKDQPAYSVWKNVFELDYLENRGSAFGLFQDQKIFLLLIGAVFMAIMIFLLIKLPAQKRYLPLHLVASGIIAGGIGNMIDRFINGFVVDFFSFILIHYPVFNVADIYIVVSTITMAILLIFVYSDEELYFFGRKK